MSEQTPQTPPVEGDNQVIRQMRSELENSKNALKAQQEAAKLAAEQAEQLKKELDELKSKDLDEKEQLRLKLEQATKEAEELKKTASEYGQRIQEVENSFQAQYERELAAIPEDKRAQVEAIAGVGATWAKRLELLSTAKALISPGAGGTVTNPGSTPPPPSAPPVNLNDLSVLKNVNYDFKR